MMNTPIPIPKDVVLIMDTLNEHRYEAFIVGGCVRDFLMGIEPKDWDIATSAVPEEVKKLFAKTFDTGIEHGTITVVMNKVGYEVTTYRIDGEYMDSRHPENVIFTEQLEQDLMRRDFTMNAIAYHAQIGYVDPYGGKKDIANQIIRGVGEPSKRFQEDALRMMRAIRFSAQLGFEIEENTYKALKQNAELIQKISIERIRDEFVKTLLSKHIEKMSLFLDSKILSYVHSDMNEYMLQCLEKQIELMWACNKDCISRLSVLFMHTDEKLLLDILKHFRFDNRTIKTVCMYVPWLTRQLKNEAYDVRTYIHAVGVEHFENILYLRKLVAKTESDKQMLDNIYKKMDDIRRNNDCCSLAQLAINGERLMALGIKSGKAIGECLQYLLDDVMHEPKHNNMDTLTNIVLSRL